MKLRSRFFAACALGLAALTACDGLESVEIEDPRETGQRARVERSDQPANRLNDIRRRADSAFDEISSGQTRFETRVGPQPWPDDLPSSWPTPTSGRVVADTKQARGDRLLLVDLPGSADEALNAYRDALRQHGYDVAQPQPRQSPRALHAKRGRDEAVLKFFDRKRATRLEILFIADARS